jgi:hypothetical protein
VAFDDRHRAAVFACYWERHCITARDGRRPLARAFERGDFSSTEWAHPEIDFEAIGMITVGGPSPVRSVGVAEMVARQSRLPECMEDLRFEVDEYRELDEDRVLVNYSDRDRALADLGLEG